jgi:NADPH:quinone reductase-like Zn-dependent oxidoreductase
VRGATVPGQSPCWLDAHRGTACGLASITTARRDGKGQDPVKVIVQDRFGPPDVLRLADTGLPEVGADDVLVRVHAAALNPADWHILRGDPLVARLMGVGLTRPKARVAGIDAAGVVAAAGANVRRLRNGDQVLGFCRGAFAEYACAAADMVVPKLASLTFEQAAAVPIAATTALRGSATRTR